MSYGTTAGSSGRPTRPRCSSRSTSTAPGHTDVSTGVGFYDHMLASFGKHGLFDLTVQVEGDLHIDAHHTVEDTAIALGQAFAQAAGDKAGTRRFGDALIPMDECLVQAAVDLSGRPYLVHQRARRRAADHRPRLRDHADPARLRVVHLSRRDRAARHRASRPRLAPRHRGAVQGGRPRAARRRRARPARAGRPVHQGRAVARTQTRRRPRLRVGQSPLGAARARTGRAPTSR